MTVQALQENMEEKPPLIWRRVFDNQNNLRGWLVATRIANKAYVGWSYCCNQDRVKFDKQFGKNLALQRMVVGSNKALHRNVKRVLPAFEQQVRKTFKEVESVELVKRNV